MTRPAYREHPDYEISFERYSAELEAFKPPEPQPVFGLPQLAEPSSMHSWLATVIDEMARALPADAAFRRINVTAPVALEFVEDGMLVREFLRRPQTLINRAYAVSLLVSCLAANVISLEREQ